jgi:rRNA maturation endonuclease Nob1
MYKCCDCRANIPLLAIKVKKICPRCGSTDVVSYYEYYMEDKDE